MLLSQPEMLRRFMARVEKQTSPQSIANAIRGITWKHVSMEVSQ